MPSVLPIVGSRTFADLTVVRLHVGQWLASGEWREIVSGGARGADTLAARVASEMGVPCTVVPADWGRFGRSAGPRRNAEIAHLADALLAFVDRPLHACRGTRDVVARFQRAGKPVHVVDLSTPTPGSAMPAAHDRAGD